jgi:hypothetical protein
LAFSVAAFILSFPNAIQWISVMELTLKMDINLEGATEEFSHLRRKENAKREISFVRDVHQPIPFFGRPFQGCVIRTDLVM